MRDMVLTFSAKMYHVFFQAGILFSTYNVLRVFFLFMFSAYYVSFVFPFQSYFVVILLFL